MAEQNQTVDLDRALTTAEKEIFTAFEVADPEDKKRIRFLAAGFLLAHKIVQAQKSGKEKPFSIW